MRSISVSPVRGVMENRRAHRLRIEIPATFKVSKNQEHISIATTVDVSALGLCLQTKETLRAGQELALTLKLPNQEKVNLNAVVVWFRTADFSLGGEYTAGIKLTESPKDEEVKFIKFYVSKLMEFYKQ